MKISGSTIRIHVALSRRSQRTLASSISATTPIPSVGYPPLAAANFSNAEYISHRSSINLTQ
jgi:ABC-type nitrate/sulfonate/bicarbonate transport system permease component